MKEVEDSLLEWAHMDVRNKDLFHKKIEELTVSDGKFVIIRKDKTNPLTYTVEPELSSTEKQYEEQFIVTLNSQKNLDFVIKQWKKLSEQQGLIIIFVNPNSTTDTKWMLNPYIHNRFCDPETISSGLQTLAENVEFTTFDEYKKKI